MTTVHDATQFTASVQQHTLPGERAYDNIEEVDRAGLRYKHSARSSADQYRALTGVEDPEDPEGTYGPDAIPDSGWLKQDIVDWLVANGETADMGMTKAELLILVDEWLLDNPQ